MTDFHADLSHSTTDCLRLMKYFEAKGNLVIDMQLDKQAQADDYDFILIGFNPPTNYKCEFKSDRYLAKTRNIAFELMSNMGRGTLGAGMKSRADYWFIMEAGTDIVHVFNLPQLKKFVLAQDLRAVKKVYPHTKVGNYSYTTECAIIPLDYLIRVPPIEYRRLDISLLEDL